MKFKDYIPIIDLTAIYPQMVINFGVAYTYLGLIDEINEFNDAIWETKWDDDEEPNMSSEKGKVLIKEAGDVVWYICALCKELNLDVESIINTPYQVAKYSERKIYNFHGDVKKFYRDGPESLNLADLYGSLRQLVSDMKHALEVKFGEEDHDKIISKVLATNSRKLKSRLRRNKIKGNGDNR